MNKKKAIKRILIAGLIAGLYPMFVVGYTWGCVARSDLQGGKNGPLDAYRHALASAVVSHTTGEFAVRLFTEWVESKHKPSGLMDRHNNMIGAAIGLQCDSFNEIQPAVLRAVSAGMVDANDPTQITWLPEEQWHTGRFW